MALYHEDILDINLESGSVHRSFINHLISEGDTAANRFGVRLFRNGQPENLNGASCIGYFIRNGSGDTIVINGGTFAGNVGYVTLPASCYAVDGAFTLVIKVTGTGFAGAMRIIDGTVIDAVIGSIVDPGSVIPDLSDLMDVIGRAETAAAAINALSITAEQITGTRYKIKVTKS